MIKKFLNVIFLCKINKVKAGHKPGSVHSFFFRNGMGNHLSGTNVTDSLKRLFLEARSMASIAPRLAPSRGLPSQHLSMLLVRSYRTFAPLPCFLLGFPHHALGGVFLWHYPHGHPHWELPSKPGQIGARTFLNGLQQCC